MKQFPWLLPKLLYGCSERNFGSPQSPLFGPSPSLVTRRERSSGTQISDPLPIIYRFRLVFSKTLLNLLNAPSYAADFLFFDPLFTVSFQLRFFHKK